MQYLMNYSLKPGVLTNQNGKAVAVVTDCKPATGPGQTLLGDYPEALDFAPSGRIEVQLLARLSAPKFCVRLLLKTGDFDDPKPKVLFSPALGVSLSLEKSASDETVLLIASVNNAQSGWSQLSTQITAKKWVLIDIVYDMDTLGLFIDEELKGISAFPVSQIVASTETNLTLSGPKNRIGQQEFLGQMAALQVVDGIPEHLENILDAQRSTPTWKISLKVKQLQTSFSLGQAINKPKRDAEGGYFQQAFENGMVFFDPADGQTAGMRGPIYEYWKTKPGVQAQLGNLLFDEMDAGKPQTRKSIFENGAIYWSNETGAVPILGKKMLSDYVKMGEAAGIVGLPKAAATAIDGGFQQKCQHGVLYYSEKTQHTAGLPTLEAARFSSEGGPAQWGIPVTSTCEIFDGVGSNRKSIGTSTKLGKNAAIFRKKGVNTAYLVYGVFLDKYLSDAVGGPTGTLGFPIAEPKIITPSIRHLAFERGAIMHIGTKSIAVPRFDIRVQRVETQNSEWSDFFQDSNDLYMTCTVKENNKEVYKKRYPTDGDIGRDTVEPQFTTQYFNPNDPDYTLELTVDVWESDPNDDDHLGVFKKVLDAKNAWGLLDDPLGLFNSGKISKINNIVWAVRPEITDKTPYDFWETGNHRTAIISEAQYASAFYDVDPEPEWYSPADWLRKLYYEVYIKDVASTGNCFGMSTEAIYAWKDRSLFGRPLSRFNDFARIEHEFNIRHCAQGGAESIGWVVGQFAKNNMHDPRTVFKETRSFHYAGQNPVICISSNWEFDDGHVILPIAWDDSKPIWEITVFDPNDNNTKKVIYIDSVKNTYTYKTKYAGGAGWDNIKKGFLYYIPWSMLDSIPYTPISGLPQFLMAILSSGISKTLSIVGADGQNLYANQSPESLAGNIENKFMLAPKMQGHPNGELLVHTATASNKLPVDFDHKLQGISNGALEYGLSFKRQAFKLKSTIAKAEQNTIGMKKMGTAQQLTTLLAPSNKLMSLTTGYKQGAGKDYVRIDVNNIPVKAGLAAQLNHQPGGNSIDILSSAEAVNTQVVISGLENGKAFRQEYDTRIEGGTRLLFSHAMSSNVLKVGKIDQVFGAMQAPKFVQKK